MRAVIYTQGWRNLAAPLFFGWLWAWNWIATLCNRNSNSSLAYFEMTLLDLAKPILQRPRGTESRAQATHSRSYTLQRGGLRTTIHTYIYNTHCSKKQQLFSIAYSSLPERDCVSSKWLCAGLGSESWWTACGFCNFAQHAPTCKHKTPELVTVSLLVLTADICIRMNCIDAHVPFWWTEEK